jgi:hypothetical protein
MKNETTTAATQAAITSQGRWVLHLAIRSVTKLVITN